MQTLKPKMPKIERPAIKRNSGLRAKVFERDQGFCVDCGRFSPRWQHDHDTSLAVAQQVEDNLCGSTPFAQWAHHHRKQHNNFGNKRVAAGCSECGRLATAELDFLKSLRPD